ncbi:DUF4347 domain-containing protein [Pseudanabaena sp. UWO310]|uniref:DUF4347 domain-containing protein n=1 Tax=Pseudanabaena sp. UWO310 TaxID=2480795 RepID=UPI00116153EF|nr:DUF4347 domain-containing protein [Pseudanabaena sp. UWO310]TYQ23867.1 DUF4347 domain-containing protein [Pseudanabaena sp. UWO310]
MKFLIEVLKKGAILAIATATIQIFSAAPTKAQGIVPAADGTGTLVLPNGKTIDITGGTQAGANLFHSFQEFGLSQGQIANFISQPSVQNILSRVVGGNPSIINGLIQVTGGNANLYIINPSGIVFGANASLNVPAAFTASTATGIQVGNGWFGINSSLAEIKTLVGTPNAFAFTGSSTAIPTGETKGAIVNQGNLTVGNGNSITLAGGIVINTGTIEAPNGKINITATPDGKYVKITPEGSLLSLDLPIADQQAVGNSRPIEGLDLSQLLTGSANTPTQAGSAVISGSLSSTGIDLLADRYDSSQANLNAPNIQQGWNVVFIDSAVKDYQTLIDGTKGGSRISVIASNQGIQQVTDTLASITGANSLHIVSEGNAGNFWLGKDFVNSSDIANYAAELQSWGKALSPSAIVLLYACNLAKGQEGAAFVQSIKGLTGHEVAASSDRTGSVASGGNWNLEYQTGGSPAAIAFDSKATNAYQYALATNTVTNVSDSGTGSLRDAIAIALNGDAIAFDPAINGQIIYLTSGALIFANSLAINGNGKTNTVIDGSLNGNNGIFYITGSPTVSFNDLTIQNGNSLASGAIVNYNNGTINISNSNLSGNYGGIYGGAIYSGGGTVNISNSNLSGNNASLGGAIYSVNTILNITNSTLSGNAANVGGAIVAQGGAINISNSTLSGNYGQSGAGAIYAFAPISISNSTLAGNSTDGYGGAIYNNSSTLDITNSTLSGNSAGFYGGAIFMYGTASIINSTLSGNSAVFGGGAIFNVGSTLTVNSSTISNNSANSSTAQPYNTGGGILNYFGTVSLANTIIAANFDTKNNSGTGTLSPDVWGAFVDNGNNLIGDTTGSTGFTTSTLLGNASNRLDPQLLPLGNYGGSTQTQLPKPTSPVINAGNNVTATADQRGYSRIVGGVVDIGAVEVQGYTISPVNGNKGFQLTENNSNTPIPNIPITVTVTSSSGETTSYTTTTDASGIASLQSLPTSLGTFTISGAIASKAPVTSNPITITNAFLSTNTYKAPWQDAADKKVDGHHTDCSQNSSGILDQKCLTTISK